MIKDSGDEYHPDENTEHILKLFNWFRKPKPEPEEEIHKEVKD